MALRLSEPLLARAGAIPSGRGCDMSPLVPELSAVLPADVQLDGEVVAPIGSNVQPVWSGWLMS